VTDPDKTQPIEKTLTDLHASPAGLTSSEAEQRLQQYGPNALKEKKISPLMRFLHYFWGPIPWMIEVAVILSACWIAARCSEMDALSRQSIERYVNMMMCDKRGSNHIPRITVFPSTAA